MNSGPWFVHVVVFGHYSGGHYCGGYEFPTEAEARADADKRRGKLGALFIGYWVSYFTPEEVREYMAIRSGHAPLFGERNESIAD